MPILMTNFLVFVDLNLLGPSSPGGDNGSSCSWSSISLSRYAQMRAQRSITVPWQKVDSQTAAVEICASFAPVATTCPPSVSLLLPVNWGQSHHQALKLTEAGAFELERAVRDVISWQMRTMCGWKKQRSTTQNFPLVKTGLM